MVQQVALALKSVLDELHLRAYPKTSGASGIHVYLPILENRFSYEDVRVFAEAIARLSCRARPRSRQSNGLYASERLERCTWTISRT